MKITFYYYLKEKLQRRKMGRFTSGADLKSGMLSTVGAEVTNLMALNVGENHFCAAFRAARLVRKTCNGMVETEAL